MPHFKAKQHDRALTTKNRTKKLAARELLAPAQWPLGGGVCSA
jgi:hypothetical protein